MIRFAPQLSPLPPETRDLVLTFLGPTQRRFETEADANERAARMQVSHVVRMPRYLQVGLSAEDGGWIEHGLDGDRIEGNRTDGRGSLRAPSNGPEDEVNDAFDGIVARLRHALAGAKSVLETLGRVPEEDRLGWQVDLIDSLRKAVARLDLLAFEECDAVRKALPKGG